MRTTTIIFGAPRLRRRMGAAAAPPVRAAWLVGGATASTSDAWRRIITANTFKTTACVDFRVSRLFV